MVELEVSPFMDIMESRKENDIPMDFIRSGIYIIESRPGSTIYNWTSYIWIMKTYQRGASNEKH
jgi:hypothetical protein